MGMSAPKSPPAPKGAVCSPKHKTEDDGYRVETRKDDDWLSPSSLLDPMNPFSPISPFSVWGD